MFHHTRGRALIILLLLSLVGGAAQAQKYEVRTFLAPSTTAEIASGKYLYLQSSIKERYVCPYCSFSRWTTAPGTSCPNPWGVSGHPAGVPLVDVSAVGGSRQLASRLLSLGGSTLPSGSADVDVPAAAGGLERRAVLGRPFKPLDGADARRSGLYAQAAGLVNADGHDGPVISAGQHGRFLIIRPNGYREDIPAGSGTTGAIPARKVMAQVDPGTDAGGNDDFQPQVFGSSTGAPAIPDGLDGYLSVGVNPYRVDDGDYWWVRYREIGTDHDGDPDTPAWVTEVHVDIYSVTYGWDGALGVSGNPETLILTPTTRATYPLTVMTRSGALRLTFDTSWATGGDNTWTVGFMTRSTCQLVPGWRDMRPADGTNAEPWYYSLDDGAQHNATSTFDLVSSPFPGPKEPSFAITNGTPSFTTESSIEEAGKTLQPVVLPANVTGQGTVAVQWARDADAGWLPQPLTNMDPLSFYYVNGGEWQYDARFDAATGATKDLTNEEVRLKTVNYSTGLMDHVVLLAGRFMCTSLDATPTGQQWRPDDTVAASWVEQGIDATWRYPRAVMGWLSGGVLTGNFAPGSTTPGRSVRIVNRWNGATAVGVCETCGAVFPGGVPTHCPYHAEPGVTATTLTVTGITDPAYTSYNGIYNASGLNYVNGSGRWIFRSGTRWYMGPAAGCPNPQRCYRTLAGQAVNGTWQVNPLGGASAPAPTVSAPGGTGGVATLAPLGGGALTVAHDAWREAATYSVDERLGGPALTRQTMSADAILNSGATIPQDSNAGSPAFDQLWVAVPRFQAPSVPGVGAINNQAADVGYRGGQVLYHNLTAPNSTSGLSSGWDCFYRNPDLGYYQPSPGVWPFLCPAGEILFTNGSIANCPVHGGALTEVAGRHFYCPTCGSEFRECPDTCPFDGTTISPTDTGRIAIGTAVREEHLTAEDYDPVDVQVSVNRQVALVATTPAVSLGRIAPGTPPHQPDAAGGVLTTHVGYPVNRSPLPLLAYGSSDSRLLLQNQGNIRLTPTISGAHLPAAGALADLGQDNYLRVEVDPFAFSYGRKALSGPLTGDTFWPLYSPPQATGYSASEAWLTIPGGTAGAAGPTSGGFVIAGADANKPVPLGQPAGTYTGAQLQYVDLDGDGNFDFNKRQPNGSWSGPTSTADYHFNPALDLPLEPLVGLLQGQARVFEARLPQNDVYAADSDPVVLPSPTPGVMQVVWSTNRLSTTAGSAAPGLTPGAIPTSTSAINLVYLTAANVNPANDILYRGYTWPTSAGALSNPSLLTQDPDGAINGSPWAIYAPDNTTRWAFWHRQLRHAGGVESTLRYKSTTNAVWPAAAPGFVYDTGLPKQGLRGFFQAAGAWLFWHAGNPGRERLYYRWDFDGTPTHNEAPLPVTNQVPAGETNDLVNATLADGSAVVIRRPSGSPFTYTKDVSVDQPYNNMVNVFFSGFVTSEGQADICSTRFRLSSLGPARNTDNYGKVPYPRLTGEEMQPDGLHQSFGSRHLDWLVDRDFATTGPGTNMNPDLRLQLAFDQLGDGTPPVSQSFGIDWASGSYDRASGTYRVTPIFYGSSGARFPAAFGIDVGSGQYLVDPHSPAGNPRPITMEINAASGTIRFSSPLFNEDAPADRTAALRYNAADGSGYASGGFGLDDVVLHINYTPYIYRVTRSEAQDDAPSAWFDRGSAQRLTVFWRRTYPNTDAPHFGRPAFMYKVWTTSVQVGQLPMSGNATVYDLTTLTDVTGQMTQDPAAGLITAPETLTHDYLRVTYNDSNSINRIERHQVLGWSREMLVPVATVAGEGPLVAVPEVFQVPNTEGGAGRAPATRYWLFWSSPRGVYDLRLVEDPGTTRVAPYNGTVYDPAIHSSADIYTAVVAPEFGSLAPELAVPTIVTTGT